MLYCFQQVNIKSVYQLKYVLDSFENSTNLREKGRNSKHISAIPFFIFCCFHCTILTSFRYYKATQDENVRCYNLKMIHFVFFFSIYFYQLEANYFTILQWFLSCIDMNQPWSYMYSPSRSHLPPPSLPDPSGSSQCTRPEHFSKKIEMIHFVAFPSVTDSPKV